MKFYLQLPTNETVQIKLSFKLLTPSKALAVYRSKPEEIINGTLSSISSKSTTTPQEFISEIDDDENKTTTLQLQTTTGQGRL